MKVTDMTFKAGEEFKICVKPSDDCKNFSINIGHDPDNLAMHFNPRFDHNGETNTIVLNSLSGGCWADGIREPNFPFVRGEECKLYINLNRENFFIKLPDGSMLSFPNRPGDLQYKYFSIAGDARAISIKIK